MPQDIKCYALPHKKKHRVINVIRVLNHSCFPLSIHVSMFSFSAREMENLVSAHELSRVAFRSATRSRWGGATQRQRGQEEGRRKPRVIGTMYSTVLPL